MAHGETTQEAQERLELEVDRLNRRVAALEDEIARLGRELRDLVEAEDVGIQP
jgi:uncharacterized small protein (DUF1192 family)